MKNPRFIAVTEFTAHYCNPIKNKTKHLPEHFKHFREIVGQCVVYLYVVYHAPVIRVHKQDDKQNIDKYWHLEGYLHTATNMLAGDLSTCGLSIN